VTVEKSSKDIIIPKLQLVAWEVTRSCNLLCDHCRASAVQGPYSGELNTAECFNLVDEITEVGSPILILTGGEPLLRSDIFKIADYASSKGLRVVLGTNGTLIDPDMAAKMQAVPVARIGVSLDFPTPELQDKFRGQAGAFDAAIRGITNARRAGIGVQINATITKLNACYLDDLLALANELEAVAFHPFMLVPTGRGKGLAEVELSPQEYEDILNWIYDKQQELGDRMFFKPTDAPHYLRIVRQRQKQSRLTAQASPASCHREADGHSGNLPHAHAMNALSRGCLAGTGFCFVSHRGDVQGCGYLDVQAGNVREQKFTQIWNNSQLFCDLRDLSLYKGKCGQCEYRRLCGGCRARAFEATGDYLEAEPYCIYEPQLAAQH
jgi:heme b synthase